MIVHDDALCTLYLGDCVEVMRELPADSIDAIVTDPPYGLEFMGKEWDALTKVPERDDTWSQNWGGYGWHGAGRTDPRRMQAWHEAWAREAFRVAKPGAHLLAFGGTRTYHRLASAIEDAGWEIRDCLVWAYASGFPKSLDVSKAIDRAAGAERVVTAIGTRHSTAEFDSSASGEREQRDVPATPDAARWNGWGTALKPAWEPIVMARKPLRGTVAANVLAHGTGAINVDGTRIPTSDDLGTQPASRAPNRILGKLDYNDGGEWTQNAKGRWPANLLLTDPIFDGDTPGVVGGGTTDVAWTRPSSGSYEPSAYGLTPPAGEAGPFYGDSGTYSRFFLIPKSSRSDREPVLRGQLAERESLIYSEKAQGPLPQQTPSRPSARENGHPTVKPVDLMRHLVRLITPPGGTVLDPFLGSGTTAIAANAEGFRCIGIEKEREYLDITLARMAHQPLGLQL